MAKHHPILDSLGRAIHQPQFEGGEESLGEALAERGIFDIPQIEEYLDSRGFR